MKEVIKNIKNGLNGVVKTVKKNKAISIGILCGIVAIIISIGIGVSFSNKSDETKQFTLNEQINELGSKWYEEKYYPGVMADETLKENFLEKFADIGIKVNLENLYRTVLDDSEESAKIKTRFEAKKCDLKNSKAIIYPQSPYGLNDYKIEANLECE